MERFVIERKIPGADLHRVLTGLRTRAWASGALRELRQTPHARTRPCGRK
jgi:hypothetical protein